MRKEDGDLTPEWRKITAFAARHKRRLVKPEEEPELPVSNVEESERAAAIARLKQRKAEDAARGSRNRG